MVQLPAAFAVINNPLTVLIDVVLEVKVTGKPEEAFAFELNAVELICFVPGFANVMVCAVAPPIAITKF